MHMHIRTDEFVVREVHSFRGAEDGSVVLGVVYQAGPAFASAAPCPAVLWADTDLLSGMPL